MDWPDGQLSERDGQFPCRRAHEDVRKRPGLIRNSNNVSEETEDRKPVEEVLQRQSELSCACQCRLSRAETLPHAVKEQCFLFSVKKESSRRKEESEERRLDGACVCAETRSGRRKKRDDNTTSITPFRTCFDAIVKGTHLFESFLFFP